MNFLTPGKRRCRGFWSRHSYGNVLLLSDENLSDVLLLRKNPRIENIVCPENDRFMAQHKQELVKRFQIPKVQVIYDDFENLISSEFSTFIPDLQDPWCLYAEGLIKKICRSTKKESVLFLTISRYNGRNGRFLKLPNYCHLRTRLDYIRSDIEEPIEYIILGDDSKHPGEKFLICPGGTIAQNGCRVVPISRSIFEYEGVPAATSKSLGCPPMFHFGYKIIKETK